MNDRASALAGSASVMNWCSSHTLTAGGPVARPGSVGELVDLLGGLAPHQRVQLLGSRYSWHELVRAGRDTVSVDMSGLRGVYDVADDRVRVAGGTTLADVAAYLRRRGRRLACSPAVIAGQTVAGALATGTHGQGLAGGSIADAVTGVSFVDMRGRSHWFTSLDRVFGATLHHLGLVGVLVAVEFATVPDQPFHLDKRVVTHKWFTRAFVAWNWKHDFCKAWWFPGDDVVHVWLVREGHASPQAEVPEPRGGPDQLVLNDALDASARRLVTDTKAADESLPQFRTLRRFHDLRPVTADLDTLLCNGIAVAQINCEIGVPLDRFEHAQHDLLSWYRRCRPALHYPIILRVTGPSAGWLSPAYKRPTCFYGFVVYQATDGTFRDGAFEHLAQVQTILAAHGGVPHWGKFFDPALFDLARLPRWGDFAMVRDWLDPHHQLGNDHVRAILSSPRGPRRQTDQPHPLSRSE